MISDEMSQQINAVMRGEVLPEIKKPRKRLTVYLSPEAALDKYLQDVRPELQETLARGILDLGEHLVEVEDTVWRKWGASDHARLQLQALKGEIEAELRQMVMQNFSRLVLGLAFKRGEERQKEQERFGKLFKTRKEALRATFGWLDQKIEEEKQAREEEERLNPELKEKRQEERERWSEAFDKVQEYEEERYRAEQRRKPRYVELGSEGEA